ncbi:MAG: polysaccharide biosynthesis protein [Chloroflexi bacterium]|nr:polysaccharide biosynthesis protein [Chloroflexota bacterium]
MLSRFRNSYFFFLDLILLALTPVLALALRVNLPWNQQFNQGLLYYVIFSLPVKILVFYLFGFYKRLWRYASVDAIISILWGVGFASVVITGSVAVVLGAGWLDGVTLPRSIPIIDSMLTLIVIGGTRLSLRLVQYQAGGGHSKPGGKRVLIAGAGDAGQMVAREMHTSKHIQEYLVGFVDDDPIKIGSIVHNSSVLGSIDRIPMIVESKQVDEVIIAMPTAPGEVIRKIVNLCEQSGVPTRTLPGIFELISGEVTVNQLREVQVGDLLRREPVQFGAERVRDLIRGKRVLVTGAGGSIGSELCSQISQCQPDMLFALGHGENSLFNLPDKIKLWSPEVKKQKLNILIADIRDLERLENIFKRIQPEIVFHAAAHKHVPLMEQNLEDAITNNIQGTKNILSLSKAHGVERFVYISTDKAVEPINVMGMTKRVGEKLVSQAAAETAKPFVSVRFGNVLGSRGSVVPFFKKQIAAGGPVTITHPDVERFFMTIPEAVQLVLQASALGTANEIFVLDMGEQIKIRDLAVELIQLSGLEVGRDIEIVYTGLRPGEKLSEALYGKNENPHNTDHEKIRSVYCDSALIDENFSEDLEALISFARQGEINRAMEILQRLALS